MKKKYIITIAIICLFNACSMKEAHEKIKFSEGKTLFATKIPTNALLAPDFVTTKGDHFIVSSSSTDTVLYVYSTPELNIEHKTGTKGKGPGEINAFPMFCEASNSKYLYIWGYSPVKIKKIQIERGGSLIPKEDLNLDKYENFNCMNIVQDSLLIYYSPDELTIKKFDLKNGKHLNEIKLQKDDHPESFFYSNRGNIIANNSCIVYAYVFKKQIDIYDLKTLKLKKRLTGDGNQNIVIGDFGNSVYYYTNIVSGKNYFYAVCQGRSNSDYEKSLNEIEVFDYDGKPVKKFLLDPSPGIIAIDEKNQMIYGYNHRFENYFLKYDMGAFP